MANSRSDGGSAIERADPDIARLIRGEARRQALSIELIASENFVSDAVLEAMGSVLTNKYAEGYPGRRYYGGCEVVDEVEQLAIGQPLPREGLRSAPTHPRHHPTIAAGRGTFLSLQGSRFR